MKLLIKLASLCFVFALVATPVVVNAQDAAPVKTEKKSGKAKGPAKIDINRASAEQLASLPGIDVATANKIIAGRPYGNKTQLKSKNIITSEAYESIKDRIVARQEKKGGKAPKGDKKNKAN
ncbi:DNA uptake protein ComE-like DNA-binding protein [Ereboglobus sp. PH5-10]|uniref:ComEA family DNA-binding protein n=1 Tax=Ereboglobus sp. PH5-10 TaxID=2940629 RepID=UPI0024062089|nr:helix-hairpin-helix domain-containing protein [Ereboglobus sp. PH5-10]MDF9827477.1 DNA uptake protein ComE-like DNA-binding protein [Ereboglobus sp. PH5-10]